MIDPTQFADQFLRHAQRKEMLYDGINATHTPDQALRLLVEEIGEVASAITRERWSAALDECIDVAHCALLVAQAIEREKEDWVS